MTSLSVSFDRTSLGRPPLVVGPGHAGLYTLAGDDPLRPVIPWRRKYAPTSDFLAGQTMTSRVKDKGSLPMEILIRGTSKATLDAAWDELEDCLSQFTFDTTINEDGATSTWSCDTTDPVWRQSKAYRAKHWATAVLAIPIHPIPVGG